MASDPLSGALSLEWCVRTHHSSDNAPLNGKAPGGAQGQPPDVGQRHLVRRPVGDPGYVVIDLDFASTMEAQAFLDFLRETVWSSNENSPALVGTPQTKILEPAESP